MAVFLVAMIGTQPAVAAQRSAPSESTASVAAAAGDVDGFTAGNAAIATLLRATAELDVDRCVLSVTANAIDNSVCAVLRVVAAELALVEQAAERLVADGLVVALPGAQEAGVVATLPLGGGARSLAELVNQVRS